MQRLGYRKLLALVFIPSLLLGAGGVPLPVQAAAGSPGIGRIQHVVEIMLENHSYDNLFGNFPRGDGIPSGWTAVNPSGDPQAPRMQPTPAGSGQTATADINHENGAERAAMDGGRMDLYPVVMGPNSMVVYGQKNIPNLWDLATHFTLADHYFQPVIGPTLPNRLYAIAAQSGGLLSDQTPSKPLTYPTIFNRLTAKGVSWKYYQGDYRPWMYNAPQDLTSNNLEPVANAGEDLMPLYLFSSLHGNQAFWNAHVGDVRAFLNDVKSGNLPAYSFITPDPLDTEHPPASLTAGDAWLGSVVQTIMSSPYWDSTAIFITYDESGGYFDHVAPSQISSNSYGPRIPLVIVSPYARPGYTFSGTADHTSILAFVEQRWGLAPLTHRDATANPLLGAFNFQQTPLPPVQLPNVSPRGTVGTLQMVGDNLWSGAQSLAP